jgi:uncharacterized membrane protein (TIGR02234 family)
VTVRSRAEFSTVLLLELLGGAGALLISTRTWQTVWTPRPRPLADDVLQLTGRTVDPASTALALVALAGAVAVLATGGRVRRAIGLVLGATGAALVWRALLGLSAIGPSRARALVESMHSGVGIDASVTSRVTTHPLWAVLSAVCGALVAVAGALVTARGHRWAAMSAKYESPVGAASSDDPERDRLRADASLWAALDRGDDPTRGGNA